MIKETLKVGDRVKFYFHEDGNTEYDKVYNELHNDSKLSNLREGILENSGPYCGCGGKSEYYWKISFIERRKFCGTWACTKSKEAYKLKDGSYYIRIENY